MQGIEQTERPSRVINVRGGNWPGRDDRMLQGPKYDILRPDSCIPMVLTHHPLLETGEILLSSQCPRGQVDCRSKTARRLITQSRHAGGSVLLRSIFKSDSRTLPQATEAREMLGAEGS